ncbi:hypothetical protein [Halobacteriovorax sp.]|uniref:hypothetical protein n=1 Tax=Halobacteriovorax sp. TaxID=2020862 RepID=UPI0035696556
MKLQILKMTIFYTLFSFSTLSATCEQGKLEPTLSMNLKKDIHSLEIVTSSVKRSYSDDEILSCLENIDELEFIQKDVDAAKSMLNYYERSLQGVEETKKVILQRVLYFKERCQAYGTTCSEVEYHRNKYKEQLTKQVEFRMEAAKYIEQTIDVKRKKEAFAKTFDTQCESNNYDKEQVISLCKKMRYNYEFPVCRNYM